MIQITNKKDCCGCFACANICPKGCIEMLSDNEGFLYPKVDKDKCVDCGLCEKSCPIINDIEKKNQGLGFAVINKDEAVRLKSSSGGVFTSFAEYVIKNGGVVFGAAFTDNLKSVEHIAVTNTQNLYKLQGSKYLQSKIGDTYKQAKDYLQKGVPVYFSATPCQIAGLYAYLGKDYDNLVTQDLICHGVPSPSVWQKYVGFREEKSNSKTSNVFFRCKKTGWKSYSLRFMFENASEYIKPVNDDLYMRGFLSNLYLRPSCHNCNFKTFNRSADITLADFWGVENVLPDMYDSKGTSLVICHSDKGKKILKNCSDGLTVKEIDVSSALQYNSSMIKSATANANRNKFFENFAIVPIDVLIASCLKIPVFKRISKQLKAILKRIIKKFRRG